MLRNNINLDSNNTNSELGNISDQNTNSDKTRDKTLSILLSVSIKFELALKYYMSK